MVSSAYRRTVTLLGAAALLLFVAAIDIGFYESGRHVTRSWGYSLGMIWLGPTGRAMEAAAIARLRQALDTLGDDRRRFEEIAPDYLNSLRATESLSQRAVRANPLDGGAISRLAAVRWELGVFTGVNSPAVVALLELAEARAPKVSDTYIENGTILYRIGQGEKGAKSLGRAVALKPQNSGRVVDLMLSFGDTPSMIAGNLPKSPDVLLALGRQFLDAGLADEYLSMFDSALDTNPVELLPAYGDACLRAGRPGDLLTRLSKPIQSADVLAEPLRLIQRARALVQLGDRTAATLEMNRARACAPTDAMVLEAIGVVGASAGYGVAAAQDFRDALASLAVRDGSALSRSRLYREIGQAEELAGRKELAFDAYRRAIELNARDAFAQGRITDMERAAGYQAPAK